MLLFFAYFLLVWLLDSLKITSLSLIAINWVVSSIFHDVLINMVFSFQSKVSHPMPAAQRAWGATEHGGRVDPPLDDAAQQQGAIP
jgi:hypothetical protein